MDKVKFGRALGYGARHAMKSLASAADAVTSPDPNPRRPGSTSPNAARITQVTEGLRQVSAAKREVKTQAMTHAKRSLWAPLKSFSSVVWLQVTGMFFAIFALTMGSAVVVHRDYFALSMTSENGRKIYFYLLAFVVFGYFTLSNFIRASRRQKR